MQWGQVKNLLIIRPDNMGDLIMSSPAIRAVKQTFGCRITVLTTHASAQAVTLIPEIDDVIKVPLPWIKIGKSINSDDLIKLISYLRSRNFDACIIFTVFSQNSLPSAMLAWMANIPKRLGYCRENPYELLNYWLPDAEPYSYILHQVERDMRLVNHIGVIEKDSDIKLNIPLDSCKSADEKLNKLVPGITDFIIIHAGVSELKRAYPIDRWIELSRAVWNQFSIPVLFSGAANEKPLADHLQKETGEGSYSVAGLFDIPEMAAFIYRSRLLISVNTGPVHIASGLKKPVIVLYARTNPQHTPWKTESKVFEFSVNSQINSKNEVLRYLNKNLYKLQLPYPDVSQIIPSVHALLYKNVVQ